MEPTVRRVLSRLKRFFFTQKYRFDLGYQFLALLNFTLLVITASDKLRYYTNLPRTWMLVAIDVPLSFCGVWLFGLFLDNVIRYGQAYNIEAGKRNPINEEQLNALRRIEQRLDDLTRKIS